MARIVIYQALNIQAIEIILSSVICRRVCQAVCVVDVSVIIDSTCLMLEFLFHRCCFKGTINWKVYVMCNLVINFNSSLFIKKNSIYRKFFIRDFVSKLCLFWLQIHLVVHTWREVTWSVVLHVHGELQGSKRGHHICYLVSYMNMDSAWLRL